MGQDLFLFCAHSCQPTLARWKCTPTDVRGRYSSTYVSIKKELERSGTLSQLLRLPNLCTYDEWELMKLPTNLKTNYITFWCRLNRLVLYPAHHVLPRDRNAGSRIRGRRGRAAARALRQWYCNIDFPTSSSFLRKFFHNSWVVPLPRTSVWIFCVINEVIQLMRLDLLVLVCFS